MSSASSYVNEKGEVIVGRREKRRRTTSSSTATSSTTTAAESKRLVVVLENAALELISPNVGDHKQELLNVDDHQHWLRRKHRDLAEARPDITHQCLYDECQK
jgi:hypothetical protein